MFLLIFVRNGSLICVVNFYKYCDINEAGPPKYNRVSVSNKTVGILIVTYVLSSSSDY